MKKLSKILTFALLFALWLGFQMFDLNGAKATPQFPGDIAIPTQPPLPPPEIDCWEEGPNGIEINNCFANPTQPPEPPETPTPSPSPEGDDNEGDPAGDNNSDGANTDQGPTIDLATAGGCSLRK